MKIAHSGLLLLSLSWSVQDGNTVPTVFFIGLKNTVGTVQPGADNGRCNRFDAARCSIIIKWPNKATAPPYLSSLLCHTAPSHHQIFQPSLSFAYSTHTSFNIILGFSIFWLSFLEQSPDSLRSIDTYSSFRFHLKTCIFPQNLTPPPLSWQQGV